MIVKKVDEVKRSLTLVPESGLDLLNVFRLVQPGDILFSETSRELKRERAWGRPDSERVTVTLGIEVEKKNVDPLMRRVSFGGRIVYESRPLDLVGKYHTIRLHPGVEVIVRRARGFERLMAFASNYLGSRRRRRGRVFLCVALDNEGVAVAEFSDAGLKTLYSERISSFDKEAFQEREKEFEERFGEVVEVLRGYLRKREDAEVVVLGPQIFVDDFMRFLKREGKDVLKRVGRTGYVSVGSEEGVLEAMRSGALREYAEAVKPLRDAAEAERFIEEMSRNPEKVALGLWEVLEAWRLGAVKKVLASESFLWEHIAEEDVARLLDAVESGKLEMQVLLDGLEASEKVSGFGGIVAFLRYPLPLKRMKG